MAIVHKFKSTDAGAPALSGEVDKLRAVLQAILVDGYNAQTITITRSGTTATASCTSHGFVDKHVLLVAGADQTEYNGEVEITYVDANTFTFSVAGSPASPATGTITAKVAPMGWTQPYTGTNKGAFLQPAGSNGFYLRVDDSNAQNAQVRGYETMSDVDTGTNLVPTNAQIAVGSGLYIYKSSAASATARTWKAWGDKKSLFMVINTDGSNLWHPLGFGDFHDFSAGNAYGTYVSGAPTSSAAATGTMPHCRAPLISVNPAAYGSYIFRDNAATAGAVTFFRLGGFNSGINAGSSSESIGGSPYYPATYPAPIQGGLLLDPIYLVGDSNSPTSPYVNGLRGRMRGLFAPGHVRPLTNGDTFSGAAGTPFDGRTFEAAAFGVNGQIIVQTSDWGVDG
jgi:hypothetical protein